MDNLYNRVARRRRKGEGGFTLIELLVVIAILGVLAAIVVFNVTGVKGTANTSACAADAQTVQDALDQFYIDNDDSYAPNYLPGTVITSNAQMKLPGKVLPATAGGLDAYLNNPPAIGPPPAACASLTLQASTGATGDVVVSPSANP